jgi:hypothetical protein
MEWTLKAVQKRLVEIKAKGFLSIPEGSFRTDDGVVGQVLEREFHVQENNLRLRDLGEFELKALRKTSKNLTLAHKSPEVGMNPIQVFDRFGYIRRSNRNPLEMRKKLFCTVNGKKPNPQGLRLWSENEHTVDMFFGDEMICKWNLKETLNKIDQIILVTAQTQGKANTADEKFHYVEAKLMKGLKNLTELINNSIVVIEFSVDQHVDDNGIAISKRPHDRGPHIRIPKGKIKKAYNEVTDIPI